MIKILLDETCSREDFDGFCYWDHLYELKARWRVSVQALVRRAYDLRLFSEASYRRAFVHLNKTGQRRNEPGEPEAESPSLIAKSLDELDPDLTIDDLATHLALAGGELRALLRDTCRAG